MDEHRNDPFCPESDWPTEPCLCSLIDEVRKDERQRHKEKAPMSMTVSEDGFVYVYIGSDRYSARQYEVSGIVDVGRNNEIIGVEIFGNSGWFKRTTDSSKNASYDE